MARVYERAAYEAALIAGNMPEMDEGAEEVLAAVRELAAEHRDTGAYRESLHLTREPAVKPSRYGGKRVTDRVVWTDDPNALSIEYGHLQGERGSGERKFIPGLFIFNRAADRFR